MEIVVKVIKDGVIVAQGQWPIELPFGEGMKLVRSELLSRLRGYDGIVVTTEY